MRCRAERRENICVWFGRYGGWSSVQAISAFTFNGATMAQVSVRFLDALVQFDGTGDFAEWISKLERVARLQKVNELADLLPLFLTAGAYAVNEGIPEANKEGYDKVKSALFSAFSPNRFDACNELVAHRLADNESVDEYRAALTSLVAGSSRKRRGIS